MTLTSPLEKREELMLLLTDKTGRQYDFSDSRTPQWYSVFIFMRVNF